MSLESEPAVVPGKPAGLIARIVIGAVMGGFLGLFQLFTRANLRYVAAGVVAGACFGAFIGAIAVRVDMTGCRGMLIGAMAGSLAGVAWWLVSGSPMFELIPVASGAVMGALFTRFG